MIQTRFSMYEINMENNYEGNTSTNKNRASGRTYLYKRE